MQYDFMRQEGAEMRGTLKLSIVQKKGQVTIPIEIRQKWGVKEGDRVAFIERADGVLLSPQTVVETAVPERMAVQLAHSGLTLDALLASPLGFAHPLPPAATMTPAEGVHAVEQTFGAFASPYSPADFKHLRERFMEETEQTVIAQTVPPRA